MIHFVGAGPGAEDLITVRGQRYLEQADVVIYAGSLVNPGMLKSTKETCEIYNSAKMTLEEVLGMLDARGLCNGIMQKSDEEPLKYTREDHYPLQYNKEEGVTIDHSAAKMCS